MKKSINLILFILLSFTAFAQQNETVEMADDLYQSGKIFVVVTVLSVIFLGIVIYLILLDRKISRIEKELKNK